MDGDGGVTWFRIKVNGRLVYEEAWLNMTRTEFSLWDALPAEYRERGAKVTDVRYVAGDGMTVEMEDDAQGDEQGIERCIPLDGLLLIREQMNIASMALDSGDREIAIKCFLHAKKLIDDTYEWTERAQEMWEGQRTEGDERCSTTSRSSSKRARWTSGSTGCSTTWAITTPA